MENVIDTNPLGNENIINFLKDVVIAIKKVINSFIDFCKKTVKLIFLSNPKLVGLKRLLKREKIEYYRSISEGKSNNWRRLHDLPLIRKT